MNAIRSTVALATLAVGLAACSVNDGYYAPRSQATYYPARTTYYSAPPTYYRNWNAPNAVTAVRGSTLYARQPVQQNAVRVSREQFATAPVLSSAPPNTPALAALE